MAKNIFFKSSVLIFFISFLACSSDDDNIDPTETPITVSTQDLAITMDENPENGQVIGNVIGGTSEGQVSFTILHQSPAGAILIDATSGELKVADASIFKFEINPVITGTVKVANGSISKNAVVTITLNEVFEHKYYFGSVTLSTQAEVDAFGLNNYTHITENLVIGHMEYSEITTLAPLRALKSVGRYINISQNSLLENLQGLNNLERVGERFNIWFNPSLINIEALSKITTIGGYLNIELNDVLTNLHGLENLTEVGGSLIISSMDNLVDITSLFNLSHIGHDLYIAQNGKLVDITSLSNLIKVGGNIKIKNNNKLERIDLRNLTSLDYSLEIYGNMVLANLDGISNLNSIIHLTVVSNPSLHDLCGLSKIFASGNYGNFTVNTNAYNPTEQDLIDGNCAL